MQLLKHKTEKFLFCNDLFDWMVFINICSSKQTSMFNFKEESTCHGEGNEALSTLTFRQWLFSRLKRMNVCLIYNFFPSYIVVNKFKTLNECRDFTASTPVEKLIFIDLELQFIHVTKEIYTCIQWNKSS